MVLKSCLNTQSLTEAIIKKEKQIHSVCSNIIIIISLNKLIQPIQGFFFSLIKMNYLVKIT